MIIQFSVSNYRSIAENQVFSMASGSLGSKKSNKSFETGNSIAPKALRSACILGPNGSGKSSLVGAMDFFVDFVRKSANASSVGDKIKLSPYKFSKEKTNSPTEMEMVFITKFASYQYGFSADSNRVYSEWMFSRTNEFGAKTRTIFQREFDKETEKYKWSTGDSLKGEKDLWKKSTRENSLFLSTAVQLNSDSLRDPYNFITNNIKIITSDRDLHGGLPTFVDCLEKTKKGKILTFLKGVGLSFDDIEATEKNFEFPEFALNIINEETKKFFLSQESKTLEFSTLYKGENDQMIPLKFAEESSGTQFLISLAGPWIEALENGYTFIFDELHNNLHPLALKYIISMFNKPKINKKNAQLIFTTHDANTISGRDMDKEQIWLVEKNKEYKSNFYPLSDFNIRNSMSFAKGYLAGKYGALPFLKDFE